MNLIPPEWTHSSTQVFSWLADWVPKGEFIQ